MARTRWLAAALLLIAAGAGAQSPGGAFVRSLVVPGWGQRYAGHAVAARTFLGAEVALWGGRHVYRRMAQDQRHDYRAHAAVHAGALTAGHSRAYFDDLGFYASRQEHNLWARYQDGPQAALYADDPGTFWEWDSQAARLHYRALRNAARSADRRALYLGGAVVANHVLSAIHAARTAVQGAAPRASVGLEPSVDPIAAGLSLALVRRF